MKYNNYHALPLTTKQKGRDIISETNGKKMGRPTNNPRTKKLNLRMSEKEIADIQRCAEAMQTQRVNAIVEAVQLLKTKLNISDEN